MSTPQGRGPVATADMKARIAALREQGADVVDSLWQRHHQALLGAGYSYGYAAAQQGFEPIRPARHRRQ